MKQAAAFLAAWWLLVPAGVGLFAAAEEPQASPRAAAPATEWHQWRGPNRDGHSPDTGLLKQWPREGPPLLWETKGAGRGYSSVAVSRGRIYTMGDGPSTAADKDEYVLCFEEATGKPLWKTKVGPAYNNHGTESWNSSRSTPTVDGPLVYALTAQGVLVCLETAGGRERWRRNLDRDFGGRMMSGWGFSESPLVDGNLLVCTPGGSRGTVLALNKATGAPVWQSRELTDPAAYSSLIAVEIAGLRQYVVLTDRSVAGISARDGRLLWRADRRGETAVCATPVYKDGIVFVTSGYNVGCNAFKVGAAGGRFRVEEIYSGRQMRNHHGGVVLVGDHVYGFDDGALKCIELATGREVWADRSVGKGSVSYADGHLVLRGEGGAVALAEATPSGYREKGRFTPRERGNRPSWAHPVVSGGKLFLREGDLIYCHDLGAK